MSDFVVERIDRRPEEQGDKQNLQNFTFQNGADQIMRNYVDDKFNRGKFLTFGFGDVNRSELRRVTAKKIHATPYDKITETIIRHNEQPINFRPILPVPLPVLMSVTPLTMLKKITGAISKFSALRNIVCVGMMIFSLTNKIVSGDKISFMRTPQTIPPTTQAKIKNFSALLLPRTLIVTTLRFCLYRQFKISRCALRIIMLK